jgi:hypothetical protein
MSFNKKHVPSLDRLKEDLLRSPHSIQYYWKASALVGPSDSLDYIEMLREEKNKKKDIADTYKEETD